jgi:aminopeptidase
MTTPVEDSLDGQISFEFPGVLSGRLVESIRLRWERGDLVEATAATNQAWLRSVLTSDPGASRVGEFAFGTNPAVDRFCKDILLDEKIGGTVHIALGRAYPECGGTNQSAIHWDIVKDTRREGAVYVDGRLVLKDGVFLMQRIALAGGG